ncbi:hypothetical protein U1Q18_005128 [Sarracenia purpurea var. burkii]
MGGYVMGWSCFVLMLANVWAGSVQMEWVCVNGLALCKWVLADCAGHGIDLLVAAMGVQHTAVTTLEFAASLSSADSASSWRQAHGSVLSWNCCCYSIAAADSSCYVLLGMSAAITVAE